MKSEDLACNTGFSMTTATRLAYCLSELRSHAEFVAYCEDQKDYPDEVLIQAGEEIFEHLAQLAKDLRDLKLAEGIEEAKARMCGPTVIVKEEEKN